VAVTDRGSWYVLVGESKTTGQSEMKMGEQEYGLRYMEMGAAAISPTGETLAKKRMRLVDRHNVAVVHQSIDETLVRRASCTAPKGASLSKFRDACIT
jgi:hypothetical protein